MPLPKSYDARSIEGDIYRRWESAGCFAAGAGRRPGAAPYAIAIPPPNVTGVLHMGHALNNTLQDTLIRWQRMQGRDVLWQPGTDHAGIATESVVARQLAEAGSSREAIGRERFLQAVWAWKERSGGAITAQLRKLGASCDWSRERFTMDAGLSRAVRTQFKRLYDAGLIYRGTRMVHWSPVLRTALSDDEVDYLDKPGHLWRLAYPLVEADGGPAGEIIVETTRPETFFGDSAVAVHPDDERYRALIGRSVRLPITGRIIPIIADQHADPAKGSGAVKITPAHDPNDYEVGLRHALPLIRVIGFDGRMTDAAPGYAGMDRFACRKALLQDLERQGVLRGATEITHAVGHSERSKEPIEPMVTEQWFVRMGPLAQRALAETAAGRVRFHPERWTKVYGHWLEHARDWCISRQIWWGHRIPAWTDAATGEVIVAIDDPTRDPANAGRTLVQDEDVLDTWFSSALWPFSTLGWPDQDAALARYFPTSTLVTDRGIIYFWVARMVMASLHALDVRPFDDVYIHGTVLDERGVKMSKSLGNGIDPLIMIDGGTQRYLGKDYQCPGYGADALRYTLLDMTTEGQDLKLNPGKFETGRNFANKVWNAGRFLLMNLAERPLPAAIGAAALTRPDLGFPERWLLDRLQDAIRSCQSALERFRFNDYANSAYRFFRDDLCDWYLEWAKSRLRLGGVAADQASAVLWYAVDQVLRLLHPGMPFISEYLWQELQTTIGGQAWGGPFLMLSSWPEAQPALEDASLAPRMARLQQVVTGVRHVRNQQNLPDSTPVPITLVAVDAETAAALAQDRDFLVDRALLSELTIGVGLPRPAVAVTQVIGTLQVHIGLSGIVDADRLRASLAKQLEQKQRSLAGKEARLANPSYLQGAPPAQIAETRELIERERIELQHLAATLAGMPAAEQGAGGM